MPTHRELQAVILASADCAPYIHTNDMPVTGGVTVGQKDQAIADILNAAQAITTIGTKRIGIGTVLDVLGPVDGSAVLDVLYAASASARPVYYALKLLEQGELDVGAPATRAQVGMLTGTIFTAAQADSILGLALNPVTVSAAQVSNALRGPWGDE